MIADLAGLLPAMHGPVCRQTGQATIGWAFEVHVRLRREPALRELAAHGLKQIGGVWRIEKYDIERLGRAFQKTQSVLDVNHGIGSAQFFEDSFEMATDRRFAIDEIYARCTPGQRFQTQYATAREQIQAT